MSSWQLIVDGISLPLADPRGRGALGVAAATAVLTGRWRGRLDRGSLTHFTLDRLGSIDDILVVDRFFSGNLVKQVAEVPSSHELCRSGADDPDRG